MAKVYQLLLTAAQFALPCLLITVMQATYFFVYGSGDSHAGYKRDRHYWIGSFILIVAMHLFLFYRYARRIGWLTRLAACAALLVLYGYLLVIFF